jgi:hypothetical protein
VHVYDDPMTDQPLRHTLLVAEGLTRADQADLLDYLPDGAAEVHVADLPQGELGEPATVLILITLSFAAITGLCGWLAAKGRNIKWTFEVRAPGGVGGSFGLEISGGETPEQVTHRLRDRGVVVSPD